MLIYRLTGMIMIQNSILWDIKTFQRMRNVGVMKSSFQVRSLDVPQADSLPAIRMVVAAVDAGCCGVSAISKGTTFSERHVRYRLQAARILGLLDEKLAITTRGKNLINTNLGSEEEVQVLQACVRNSAILRLLAPDLLKDQRLDRIGVSKSIQAATGLSPATADRRASVLRAWQRQLVEIETKEKHSNETRSSIQAKAVP